MTLQNARTVALVLSLVAMIGLPACGTVPSVESQQELAVASEDSDNVLVFGKVRWVQNGQEIKVGKNLFGNIIEFQVYPAATRRRQIARVGENGQFSWALPPGEHHVPAINLSSGASSFVVPVFIHLIVPEDCEASYAGTLTLETTLKQGWLGADSTLDRMSVADDCDEMCASMLEKLGLPASAARVSLLQPDLQQLQKWANLQ